MALGIGQVLNDRYRVTSMIVQSRFSAVYQAWDSKLNSSVAIKEDLDLTAEAVQQFNLEARMLANLSHDHLPYVVDHFSLPGQGQYLVMEYIEGQDLESIVTRSGPGLPEMQVLTWFEQICDALIYLHSQSPPIFHRDIKPVNIKITPQGRAVLVDYGIEKVDLSTPGRTMQAGTAGSGYISPEQYAGTSNIQSDIYALGATLYMALTGATPADSSQRQAGQMFITPRQLNPALTAKVEAAVLKAMALDPSQRFQSVHEFKTALGMPLPPYVVQSSAFPGDDFDQEEQKPARSRGWIIWAIAVLVGFCLLVGAAAAVGAYLYLVPEEPTPTQVSLDLYLTQTALAAQLASPIPPTEAPVIPTPTPTSQPTSPPTQLPTITPVEVQTLTPTTTTTQEGSGPWEACPGIYPSRLRVGDVAYVSTEPPLPNRVRTQPNKNGIVIGFLQPGELMDILEGPSCSNEWIWWRVRSQESGMTGWTAEGDSEDYWLVPVK